MAFSHQAKTMGVSIKCIFAFDSSPVNLFNQSVVSVSRVLEQRNFRRYKSEYKKGNAYQAENCKCQFWRDTRYRRFVKLSCFIYISNRRRYKENADINPIGRLAKRAVVSIKYYRNQNKAEKCSFKLNRPKAFIFLTYKKTLYGGNEKHRKEKELHMLPSRLVYAGKKCCEGAICPIVQKV